MLFLLWLKKLKKSLWLLAGNTLERVLEVVHSLSSLPQRDL